MEEAIKGLAVGKRSINEKYLREIKNACSALYNSSELFAFGKISEYSELIGEVTERALNKEFDLSEKLIELYRQIPSSLDGMVTDDEDAYKNSEEIKRQFINILELFKKPGSSKEASYNNDGLNEDRIKEDVHKDTEDKLPTDENANPNDTPESTEDLDEEDEENGKPQFTSVRDAVKFIDKLL